MSWMTREKLLKKMTSFARLITKFVKELPGSLFNLRALWLLDPGPPTTRHCARVSPCARGHDRENGGRERI